MLYPVELWGLIPIILTGERRADYRLGSSRRVFRLGANFSMGLRGQMDHPQVRRAMRHVAEVARRHGKFPGRLATTPEEARLALDEGFLLLQGPTEVELMKAGGRHLLAGLDRPAPGVAPVAPAAGGGKPAY